jgi:hypothetical protein
MGAGLSACSGLRASPGYSLGIRFLTCTHIHSSAWCPWSFEAEGGAAERVERSTHSKVTLAQEDFVGHPVDPAHDPLLALEVRVPPDHDDLVVRGDRPERDSILDLHEAALGGKVRRDGHGELASLDWGRLEVHERALERLGEVARHRLIEGGGRRG